jgi:hypothetical protein
MSFYSNNLGKNTAKGAFNTASQGFSRSRVQNDAMAIKENLDPEEKQTTDMVTPNYYDPFGDKDYKVKYFQNSANYFMHRHPLRLDIDSGSHEGDRINTVTNEELEESKGGGGHRKIDGVNLGMINRSDAFHKESNRNVRRPPLQQLRQNMIMKANIPASSSDGFAKQNSIPKNQRSI